VKSWLELEIVTAWLLQLYWLWSERIYWGCCFGAIALILPWLIERSKPSKVRTTYGCVPKIQGFNRIRDCLSKVGIRLLTVADSIEHLPYPRQPSKALLRSPWSENPFTVNHWSREGSIQHYVPQRDTAQKERWLPLSPQQLQNRTLLQLPTGEYLWFQDQAFYELEPDAALLAMFHQDKETGYPLKLVWDKPQGRLNLQSTSLPSAYAQWLWRLSEPDSDRYRTRKIQPLNHPLVETAFQRLGCLLV
jgi:hypothetical protein